jgi:hypothetical protein
MVRKCFYQEIRDRTWKHYAGRAAVVSQLFC